MDWKKIIGIILVIAGMILLSKIFAGLLTFVLKVLIILIAARALSFIFGMFNKPAFVILAILGFIFCWGVASWIVGLLGWVVIIILVPVAVWFVFKEISEK